VSDEPIPKIKAALLVAARRQADLEYALGDLEDVLKQELAHETFPADVFTQNADIDRAQMALADKYWVESHIRNAKHS
jgi:hypothetical protein